MQHNSLDERRAAFRRLHDSGCFVIPNPWDVGSAVALAGLGFPALASTSAGLGFARGLPDTPSALRLRWVLEHLTDLAAATDLPVNADFQAGYAADTAALAGNVAACVETGVAGLSIEDTTGDPERPLYDIAEAADRIRAARSGIDGRQADVLLTGRAECFLVGHPDPLRESIARLRAYAEAGADVLYAPGVRTESEIREIVDAVAPKPVNVLVSRDIGLSVADLAGLGVRRVSLGSALSRVAWGAFLRAAEEIARAGTFAELDHAAPFTQLNDMFDGLS